MSALLPPARRQVDRHARVGPTVIGGIVTFAAVEHVCALAAHQVVVTRAADEHVLARIAFQVVVTGAAVQGVVAVSAMETVVFGIADEVVSVVRTVDLLDPRERVALGVPALPRACGQVDGDVRIGVPVTCMIVTFPAVDYVRAGMAMEPVGPVVAGKLVSVWRPVDGLDAREDVALGVPAMSQARCQVDRHAGIGIAIAGAIPPFAALQGVATSPAI